MNSTMPKLPTNIAAWILTIFGLLSFAFALWVSLPMLRSSGSGELMLGLYIAIPLLMLSALLLGICTPKQRLRSSASLWGFGLLILGIVIWISVLIVLG